MARKKKSKIFRSVGFSATFSMSLVLFVVGVITLTLFITRNMTNYVRENLNVTVLLKDDITDYGYKRMEKLLNTADYIKSYEYISKENALQEHIKLLGDNPEDFLGWNPLYASYEIKLKSDYANNDSIAKIEKEIMGKLGVLSVNYQKDMISLVNENIRNITILLIVLTAVLMFISSDLINSTIRLRVYSNRFLINTMKLVGAKPWFIQKPYIRQSVINGVIAGFLALIYIAGVMAYLHYNFGFAPSMLKIEIVPLLVGVVFGAGILLTAISTYIAVGRYIRMKTDELYFI